MARFFPTCSSSLCSTRDGGRGKEKGAPLPFLITRQSPRFSDTFKGGREKKSLIRSRKWVERWQFCYQFRFSYQVRYMRFVYASMCVCLCITVIACSRMFFNDNFLPFREDEDYARDCFRCSVVSLVFAECCQDGVGSLRLRLSRV